MGLLQLPTNRDIYVVNTAIRPYMSARRVDTPAENIHDALNLAYSQGGEVTVWVQEGFAYSAQFPPQTITWDHKVASKVNFRLWDGVTPQGTAPVGSTATLNWQFNVTDSILDIGPGFIFNSSTTGGGPSFDLTRAVLKMIDCRIDVVGSAAARPLFKADDNSIIEWSKLADDFINSGNIDQSVDLAPNPMFLIENGSQLRIFGSPTASMPSFISAPGGHLVDLRNNSMFKGRDFSFVQSLPGSLGIGISAGHNSYIGIESPTALPSIINDFNKAIFMDQDSHGFLADTAGITSNNIGIEVTRGAHADYVVAPTGNVTDTSTPGIANRLRGYV